MRVEVQKMTNTGVRVLLFLLKALKASTVCLSLPIEEKLQWIYGLAI